MFSTKPLFLHSPTSEAPLHRQPMAATTVQPLASSVVPASPASPDEQQSTSPTATALARFEYEAGRTSVNSATKVLLVEWEDDVSDGERGEWTIQWKGRKEVLRAGGKPAAATEEESAGKHEDNGVKKSPSSVIQDGSGQDKPEDPQHRRPKTHRLYFLLPPGAPVPPSVSISFHATAPNKSNPQPSKPTTAPTLPAIFPRSLGATASTAGKKGVLHTLWAKSRLAALQAEIEAEEQANIEGIGLEMALQEQEWIIENFGMGAWAHSTGNAGPSSPRTPRSAGGFGGAGARARAGSGAAAGAIKGSGETRADRADSGASSVQGPPTPAPTPISPSSLSTVQSGNPTSPTSSRLLSKMAGLRVGTSAQQSGSPSPNPGHATAPQQAQATTQMQTPPQTEDSSKADGAQVPGEKNPLSPEVGDVAVGAFADIKGASPTPVQGAGAPSQGKTAVPVAPPPGQGMAIAGMGGMASLDSVVDGGATSGAVNHSSSAHQQTQPDPSDADMYSSTVKFRDQDTAVSVEEDEGDAEGLFALPMSPRNTLEGGAPFSGLK